MDDYISRQAAIDRINKQRGHLRPDLYPQDKIGDSAYRICAEFISRLPSADRRGRWVYKEAYKDAHFGYFVCSLCGEAYWKPSVNYCPNCGSFNGEGGENDERDVTPKGRMVRVKGTKILIGTSMPTSCAECKFLCENEGRPFCLANRELITTDLEDTEIYPLRKRSKRCPLVDMEDPCSTCFVPLFYNLEDDDSICKDCEVGE